MKKSGNVLKELFGSLTFSRPTAELLKITRKELEGKQL